MFDIQVHHGYGIVSEKVGFVNNTKESESGSFYFTPANMKRVNDSTAMKP